MKIGEGLNRPSPISMNWNATCVARSARRFGAIHTSAAIWSPAVKQDFSERPAVYVVAGRTVNMKEAGVGRALTLLAILFLALLSNGERLGHVANAQTIANVLAARIRSQGFACDEPQKAKRDAKLSKADYDVWVLTCKNATYRIGRYADMAAKVEKLK
jgi:hypothetical protein